MTVTRWKIYKLKIKRCSSRDYGPSMNEENNEKLKFTSKLTLIIIFHVFCFYFIQQQPQQYLS